MKVIYWAFGWAVLVTTLTATKSLAANPRHVSQFESTGQCAKCDLSGASFVGIDFSDLRVDLQRANLNGANFTGAIMPKVNLSGASAVGSTFFETDLQGANLKNASLTYSNLVKAKLNNAILEQTDLQGANLAEADLRNAQVKKTDFVGANIYKMKYSPAIVDASFDNYFGSDSDDNSKTSREGSRVLNTRVLNTGSSIYDKKIGDRSFESGARIKRRYRIPLWLGNPYIKTAGSSRNPVPPSVGQPVNTLPLGSRHTNPENLLNDPQ
jgi:uncharacterized protein YjbI with pentapeptide repeats